MMYAGLPKRPMYAPHRLAAPILSSLALFAACGPAQPSASTSDSDSSSSSTTQTETSTQSTQTETSTQSGSEGFVPDTPTPPEDCSVWEQDCDEGQKCVPWIGETGEGWIGFLCVPVLGDRAVGEPCELDFDDSTDNCDANSSCFSFTIFAEAFEGAVCHAFCTGSGDDPTCEGPSYCLVGNGYPGPGLCIPHCDPLADECDAGQGCYWTGYAFSCSASTQDIPLGEPCGFINDCAPGYVCIGEPFPECEDACCTSYCDISLAEVSCGELPGASCVPFFDRGLAPAGLEDVGVCLSE